MSTVINDLQINRAALLSTIEHLDHTTLATPNLIGSWSIKDLLAHLAGWEDWAVQVLAATPANTTLSAEFAVALSDFDAFNAESAAERAEYTVDEQLMELERVHTTLIETARQFGDNGLAETFIWPTGNPISRERFIAIFAHHDTQHLSDLQQAVAMVGG